MLLPLLLKGQGRQTAMTVTVPQQTTKRKVESCRGCPRPKCPYKEKHQGKEPEKQSE